MTTRLERITQQRLDSLSRIRARGVNPYPHSYHPSHTIQQAITLFKQQKKGFQTISLAGRVMARRSMGKMTFFDIRDGSGKIQLCFRYNSLGQEKYEFLRRLTLATL